MNIEIWPIDKPIPYVRNPRRIPHAAIDPVAASIREFGWRQPIVVDKDGVIVVGHTRLMAAKKLGLTEVPVHVADNLTDAQIKAYRITDNRSGEFAEWDTELLGLEIDELKAVDFDVDMIGMELNVQAEIEAADAEPEISRAEEINKKWMVQPGDLWTIGPHRLLCGDSTKADDVAMCMGDVKATLVFTDPPYGVGIGKKNVMLNSFQKAGRCLDDLDMDDMSPDDLKVMLKAAFTMIKTYMADDCSIFVCSPQGGGLGMMMMMMMECGLEVRHILNWIKNSPTFSMGRLDYDYQHEPILYTWTKTHKRKKEGPYQTSLWTVNKPRANKEHPTMKPVELPINAMLNHTDEQDIVVDIFGGSGTTMVAAENTKRVARLVEISPAYCAVILERMKTAFPGIEISKA